MQRFYLLYLTGFYELLSEQCNTELRHLQLFKDVLADNLVMVPDALTTVFFQKRCDVVDIDQTALFVVPQDVECFQLHCLLLFKLLCKRIWIPYFVHLLLDLLTSGVMILLRLLVLFIFMNNVEQAERFGSGLLILPIVLHKIVN